MENLEKLIDKFFTENNVFLKENYPGINKKIVFDTFFDLSGEKINSHDQLSFNQQSKLDYFFSEMKKGRPFAYITNVGHFFGREFYIDESVLIPRFETEELVALCVEEINRLGQKEVSIGEVGVGSGCIGLTIVAECSNKIIKLDGFDISEDALNVAKKNAQKLEYFFKKESVIRFFYNDRLENIGENQFDIIVSNPPYIKKNQDMNLVHQQVKEFEPEVALFLEDSEYDSWFLQFFSQVEYSLKVNGQLLMEGHEDHLNHLKKLASTFNFKNFNIIKDLSGRDRILTFKKS